MQLFKTILILAFLTATTGIQAAWISPAPDPWNNRKAITVTNNSSTAMADYQIFISFTDLGTASLISSGKMISDYSDIRFTDSDGSTLLNHWVDSTGIYIKVSAAASTAKTIYMYYNNPAAVNISSFLNTMKISPDASTVGLWYFDEKTGTTAKDSSVNGNNGTIALSYEWLSSDCPKIGANTVTLSTGSALDLEVAGSYGTVDCSDSASFQNISSAVTIETWINMSAVGSSAKGYIACKQRGGSSGPYYIKIDGATSALDVGVEVASTANKVIGATALQINTWYHAAMTYDSSTKELKVYLNGAQDGSLTLTAAVPTLTNVNNSRSFWIGTQDLLSTMTEKFFGMVDDMAIYNRALSAEEIQAHYKRRNYISPAPSVSVGSAEGLVEITFTVDPEVLKPGLATFTYDFTTDMDTGTIPTVTLNPSVGSSINITGTWISFTKYQCTYTITSAVADGASTVSFSGAKLASGALVGAYNSASIYIDSEELLPANKEFFPNPFSPNGDGFVDTTELPLFINSTVKVNCKIFDLRGRLVRYLVNAEKSTNTTIQWDGRNDLGEIVPIGIYIYQIEVGGQLTSGSVVVTK